MFTGSHANHYSHWEVSMFLINTSPNYIDWDRGNLPNAMEEVFIIIKLTTDAGQQNIKHPFSYTPWLWNKYIHHFTRYIIWKGNYHYCRYPVKNFNNQYGMVNDKIEKRPSINNCCDHKAYWQLDKYISNNIIYLLKRKQIRVLPKFVIFHLPFLIYFTFVTLLSATLSSELLHYPLQGLSTLI